MIIYALPNRLVAEVLGSLVLWEQIPYAFETFSIYKLDLVSREAGSSNIFTSSNLCIWAGGWVCVARLIKGKSPFDPWTIVLVWLFSHRKTSDFPPKAKSGIVHPNAALDPPYEFKQGINQIPDTLNCAVPFDPSTIVLVWFFSPIANRLIYPTFPIYQSTEMLRLFRRRLIRLILCRRPVACAGDDVFFLLASFTYQIFIQTR